MVLAWAGFERDQLGTSLDPSQWGYIGAGLTRGATHGARGKRGQRERPLIFRHDGGAAVERWWGIRICSRWVM